MFEKLRRALVAACGLCVVAGLALAFAGEALFGPWRDAVARAMLGHPLPAGLREYAALTDGILGGTLVGKWVAIGWLAHEPLRRKERWALKVLLAGHLFGFAVGAAAGVLHGATVHVWSFGLLPLVLVVALALALWPHTVDAPRSRSPARPSVRVLTVVCACSIGIGLAAAFTIRAPVFHAYARATAEAYFGGVMGPDALAWQRFAYGAIGAILVGHLVVLTGMLRRAPEERWVLHAVFTSMSAWFVVDTAASLLHGGLFNVLQINLPSYLGTLAPLAFAYRSAPVGDRAEATGP